MTRMRSIGATAAVLLATAALVAGCSSVSGGDSAAPASQQGESSTADQAAPESGKTNGKTDKGRPEQPTVTRAIIKTGTLTVETDKVDEQRQAAITIAASLRGQVASEDTGGSGGTGDDGRITRASLVLKVPTAAYETAIQRLSGLGKRTSIHQESSDVTEQVVDVESRISTQRASLERIRALLAKATTIGDVVSVETELTRREADLESLLAKQKSLSLQTELATLTLVLAEPGKAPELPADDKGFVAGLKGGWNAFAATFSALATALGALLPFLILFALIGIPLWRFRHRLRRTPAAISATAGPVPGGAAGPGTGGLPRHPDQPRPR
ncbi:uncharacterized protein DUF4349 [Kribbella amoyensis]|uniref:Uncharacterized protein DUF4349 n=1 Tax=Kribbella amoyensis TaxID=996641 RepID=A0A561B707_9ACTN|nr:DUF4349 domain-containing protein [Kribbella amoyensis]TWD74765.1 uncharacterized protein DUF4349 [Kribbella amoyensis]